MKLYGFFRSGTSQRVRIALNLKELDYEQVAIDLRREEHLAERFAAINPQRLVPALDIDGAILLQSPAIIEWLEERFPAPPLLPRDPWQRAHVRALAALIGCDVHPVNNRRILEYLRHNLHADEQAVMAWCRRWIELGLDAFDKLVHQAGLGGPFACGANPGLADVYLIPQIESARRFNVDMMRWPRLCEIDAACAALPPFQRAAPSVQADAT
jgi:maleylpyruvate isomerase